MRKDIESRDNGVKQKTASYIYQTIMKYKNNKIRKID